MQTIQLPSSVRIGPYDYDINPVGVSIDEDKLGECRRNELVILVDQQYPALQTADTYLHEILHGIWDAMGIGETCEEEPAVAAMATGLLSFLRDNPDGLKPLYDAFSIANKRRLELAMNTGGSFS